MRRVLVLSLAIACSGVVHADQIVTNGNFDTNVNGWTAIALGTATPDVRDAASNPSSGSLRYDSYPAHSSSAGLGALQCIAVAAGERVTISGRLFIPSGQTRSPGLALAVGFYGAGHACPEFDYLEWTPTDILRAPEVAMDTWHLVQRTVVAPAGALSAALFLYLNQGPGSGSAQGLFDEISVRKETTMRDFAGDSRSDIVIRDPSGNLGLWTMNGPVITAGALVGSPGGTYAVAAVADFNGDGNADILLRDDTGTLGMWLMNGSIILSGHLVGSPGEYTVAAAADFNADGKADILLRDGSGTLGMWIMNGPVVTSGHLVGSPGAYTVAGAADLHGDRRADILLRDSGGNLGLWTMNGHVIAAGALIGSPGAYDAAGLGDLNGDGKADIILRDALGNIGAWMMNGSAIVSGHGVGSPGAYAVNSVGDYDGDGRVDLLLRNNATGQLGMWLMSGHLIRSGAAVGSPGASSTVY